MYEDQNAGYGVEDALAKLDLEHIKHRLSEIPAQLRDMEICVRAAADKVFGFENAVTSKDPSEPSAPNETLFSLVQDIENRIRELRVQVVRF